MSEILVVDVGTTGLRAALVDDGLAIRAIEYRAAPPSIPAPGLSEFDGVSMAKSVLEAAHAALAAATGPVVAVGITNQRASTLLWDRSSGQPLAPGLGWQDLRTVGECLMGTAEHGWALAPNQAVTKAAWLLAHTPDLSGRDLCVGTVDSWIAWVLSDGTAHVSDQTNSSATATGMRLVDGSAWDLEICDAFHIPVSTLPAVVDSVGVCGTASALPGAPPIAALLGDQQASLVGQSCVRPGRAKITFGTGGMLDLCTDLGPPAAARRHDGGTYPMPMWSRDGAVTWGVEGIMLSAGSNVDWLREDLGLIACSAESHDLADSCTDTGGVVYVPALMGLGTPYWDYGARSTLLGVTRGTERAHIVRAVLEGVAHRGADLVDAAIADTGLEIATIRIDGGMSANPTFVQALANASGRPVEVAPVADATTIGAAFMAGLAVGVWDSIDDLDDLWRPARVIDPEPAWDHTGRRQQWREAVRRAEGWIPELSALDF